MSVLICGSIAYDNIMVFNDRFKDHILPEQIHILSVSFLVPQMRQQFGGCAGNIVYGLTLLQYDEVYAMATVGKDFSAYADWLDEHGIKHDYIRVLNDEYTARAFVITDADDNQITAFHPGAMNRCHLNEVPSNSGISMGLISPEGREGMINHAKQFSEQSIPFIFDPGQGLPMFSEEELAMFISKADWIACNDYEAQVLCQRARASLTDLAQEVQALVVTLGDKGSRIYHSQGVVEIPPAKPKRIVDPTGCGDAYRAGLIYGIRKGFDWETTGRIASLMGTYKVECSGGQGHVFSIDEFGIRFKDNFGYLFDM